MSNILNAAGTGLRIIEDGLFIHDMSLPKFKKRKAESPKLAMAEADFQSYGSGSIYNEAWVDDEGDNTVNENRAFGIGVPVFLNVTPKADDPKPNFIARLKSYLWPAPSKVNYEVMTVENFFRSVMNSAEELKVVDKRASGYIKAMRHAKKNGQTALLEKFRVGLDATRGETQLVALGMLKYITEDKIVEFVKKSPKGLRLDLIQNFVKIIPEDVSSKKYIADERGVFDNYAVLHYDPQAKSFAETEEQKAARRDPILFGMILGRRQLYFVGDWKDDFCDLTLDQIADVVGKDAISEISVTA